MVSRAPTLLFLVAGAALAVEACAPGHPPAPAPPTASSAAATAQPPALSPATATTSALAVPAVPPSALPVAPPPAPTSTVASVKIDGAWASCHQTYRATGKDVSKDVAAMAKACERPTRMKLLGKTITGEQADQDKPQTFPLDAKANHCYRVYAQAVDGIKDLDLVVRDSAGIVIGQDSTDDPSPVVLETGAVCFSKDDRASVVVSVGMGSGAYAVQIWGD